MKCETWRDNWLFIATIWTKKIINSKTMLTLVSNILTSLHKTNENWTQKKCRIKNQFPGRKNDGKKKKKTKSGENTVCTGNIHWYIKWIHILSVGIFQYFRFPEGKCSNCLNTKLKFSMININRAFFIHCPNEYNYNNRNLLITH